MFISLSNTYSNMQWCKQIIMFKWASKQKDRNRHKQTSVSKSQCSPAHSAITFKSGYSSSSAKKLSLKKPKMNKPSDNERNDSYENNSKFMTPLKLSKSSQYDHDKTLTTNNLNNLQTSKKQFSSFVFNKLNGSNSSACPLASQRNNCNKKITVKLVSHTNLMLNQFAICYSDLKDDNWNPYTFAMILMKMGFISDLVHDRYLVKSLWEQLQYPDALGLYSFIERVMGNRINLDEAEKKLTEIDYNRKIKFSIKSASIILHSNLGKEYIQELKNRRINRREGIHI